MINLTIQQATIQDLPAIRNFTDYWLAGRGIVKKAPGAVNDYFISPSQHKKYIEKYKTFMAHINDGFVAWAVIQNDGSLIHLLVAGTHRGLGIGSALLKHLSPEKVHSKSNQSTGNPEGFYEKQGYKKTETRLSRSRLDIEKIKPDRKPIIDIFEKVT